MLTKEEIITTMLRELAYAYKTKTKEYVDQNVFDKNFKTFGPRCISWYLQDFFKDFYKKYTAWNYNTTDKPKREMVADLQKIVAVSVMGLAQFEEMLGVAEGRYSEDCNEDHTITHPKDFPSLRDYTQNFEIDESGNVTRPLTEEEQKALMGIFEEK